MSPSVRAWSVEATVAPPDYDPLRLACERAQLRHRGDEERAAIRAGLDMSMTALARRQELGLPVIGHTFAVAITGGPEELAVAVRRIA